MLTLFWGTTQKNGKWEESISLSKQDKLFKDSIVTASTSGSTDVAEELITYFVDIGNKECFAAMLYACFDLLRSDVVEELSWRNALNDFFMPYKLQSQRHLVEKVRVYISFPAQPSANQPLQLASLQKEITERSKKDQQKEQQEADQPIINPGFGSRLMITQNGWVAWQVLLVPYSNRAFRFTGGPAPPFQNGVPSVSFLFRSYSCCDAEYCCSTWPGLVLIRDYSTERDFVFVHNSSHFIHAAFYLLTFVCETRRNVIQDI